MKQDFFKPIEVEFISTIQGNKFYTLDGKEVTMRKYAKKITSMEELSRAELRQLVLRFSHLQDNIRDIRLDINKLEI